MCVQQWWEINPIVMTLTSMQSKIIGRNWSTWSCNNIYSSSSCTLHTEDYYFRTVLYGRLWDRFVYLLIRVFFRVRNDDNFIIDKKNGFMNGWHGFGRVRFPAETEVADISGKFLAFIQSTVYFLSVLLFYFDSFSVMNCIFSSAQLCRKTRKNT